MCFLQGEALDCASTDCSGQIPLIETEFDFTSTAAEVTAGVDLTMRRAVATGGASGIGTETVRALALCGAAMTIAVRNVEVLHEDPLSAL